MLLYTPDDVRGRALSAESRFFLGGLGGASVPTRRAQFILGALGSIVGGLGRVSAVRRLFVGGSSAGGDKNKKNTRRSIGSSSVTRR